MPTPPACACLPAAVVVWCHSQLTAASETVHAINLARLSATRAMMLGAGDVLVMDNYRCAGWTVLLLLLFCKRLCMT